MDTVERLRIQTNTWGATGIPPQPKLLRAAADELAAALERVKELESMFKCQNCYDRGWVVGVVDQSYSSPEGEQAQVDCPTCKEDPDICQDCGAKACHPHQCEECRLEAS